MRDETLTASAVVRFAAELEADSAAFYERLARRLPQHQVLFVGFAQACRKTAKQVQRTYQETVTDALETGFAFEGLRLEDYEVDLVRPGSDPDSSGDPGDISGALERALALESTAIAFYQGVADRSSGLLATIPRAFRRAARTRRRRCEVLSGLA
jgi:rubrerythrin